MGLFGGGSGADWLIAGLGNPEPKYDGTRHNTGFAALDALAEAWGCEINKSKCRAFTALPRWTAAM